MKSLGRALLISFIAVSVITTACVAAPTVALADDLPTPAPKARLVAHDDVAVTKAGHPVKILWADLVSNDIDPGGGTLLLPFGHANPSHAALSDFSHMSGPGGYVLYSPDSGFVGNDSFQYDISNNKGNTSATSGTVIVHVLPQSAPVGVSDTFTLQAGATLTVAAPGVLANDTDADGDALKAAASLYVPPAHGVVTMNSAHDGGFTYKPTAGYVGTDTFFYSAADTAGAVSAQTKVTLTINEVIGSTPAPTIVGAAAVGQTLTAKPGVWSPSGVTLAYQWLSSGLMITGATASTFTLTQIQAGQKISVRVTGSKPGATTVVKTSASTAAVTTTIKKLTATPVPTITGTVAVGSTLTAHPGAWSPAPVTFAYKWQRGATTIAGATGATYKLTAADAGYSVFVFVTGSKAGYTAVTTTSASVVAPLSLTKTPTPVITGTPKVGSTLTATAGTWSPAPVTLSYQWKRSGVTINGATSASYKLTAADATKTITVTVTGSKPVYTTVKVTSLPTAAVKA
ncbi:MAG: hypothetical protein JWQ19_2312 [Subtercola sp.]|nr:hypothetical protein [Subtercola sp.]